MTGATVPSDLSLGQALDYLKRIEGSNLPDIVVPLNGLAWTPDDHIVIPGVREARPNEWARQQLSSLLGFKFDRWFEAASPDDRANEMNRRLGRAGGTVRLRLARSRDTTTLRAVVSPSYSPLEDSSILNLLATALQNTNAAVRRLDVTERMTSVLLGLGRPQRVGGIVGEVWGGIRLVNSNVGWAGLSVSASLERLTCSNGMRAPTLNAQLVRVRHRSIVIDEITAQLESGLDALPKNLADANRLLTAATQWPVVNVKAEARELLRERGMIRTHLNGVLRAFRQEPHESVFGVAQAITRHAQQVSPEDRTGLEELAGSYVLRSAP